METHKYILLLAGRDKGLREGLLFGRIPSLGHDKEEIILCPLLSFFTAGQGTRGIILILGRKGLPVRAPLGRVPYLQPSGQVVPHPLLSFFTAGEGYNL